MKNSRSSAWSYYIRVLTVGLDLDYIRSAITTAATNDIKVPVTWIDNNTSSNNYIVVNKRTKKVTTNYVYNR
jgi:hypothetical protein